MDRRVGWLVLGVTVVALTTAAQLYLSGSILVGVSLAGLATVGGILVILARPATPRPREAQVAGGGDLAAFLRTHGVWAIAYFISGAMIFFGLWVLSDLYLSRRAPMFPSSMIQPALVCLALGLSVFLISNHKTRE
jgi:hypothetical protein